MLVLDQSSLVLFPIVRLKRKLNRNVNIVDIAEHAYGSVMESVLQVKKLKIYWSMIDRSSQSRVQSQSRVLRMMTTMIFRKISSVHQMTLIHQVYPIWINLEDY